MYLSGDTHTLPGGPTFRSFAAPGCVGFEVTTADGRTEYVYLRPSTFAESGEATVLMYRSDKGIPDTGSTIVGAAEVFSPVPPRTKEQAEFLVDVATLSTNLMECWWGFDHLHFALPDGDREGPIDLGPDGAANAEIALTAYNADHVRTRYVLGLDELQRVFTDHLAAPVKDLPAEMRQELLAAYRECDAVNLDCDHAEVIFSLACFGALIH